MDINSTSSVGSTAGGSQTTSTTSTESKGLGQDDFMKLLLAQLQNQDPLKPMEDKDFIAQLAQFNSLSQLTQMNKNLAEMITTENLAQGSALIGRTVTGLTSSGGSITGPVSGLRLIGGKVTLLVNGEGVALDSINSVQVTPENMTDGGQN